MNTELYIQQLDDNTSAILTVANNCTPEQLNARIGEGWSVLEVLEHIFITDKVIYKKINSPQGGTHTEEEILGNGKLQHILVNKRDTKITAPDTLQPKGVLQDTAGFEQLFTTHRDQLKEEISNGTLTIDNRIYKHPFLGDMTVADWLYFVVYHAQRHLDQVKEILNSKG